MNPLAVELNNVIEWNCQPVYEMLSERGKNLYFPKGILSQGAEAKEKAHRFNATIGTATEGGTAMHLPCIRKEVPNISPNDLFNYAPASGKPELRDKWLEKQLAENPSLKAKHFSRPIVTAALTHGLSLIGDLFVDPGDVIVLPDQLWGNYRLCYGVRLGAAIRTFPMFTGAGGFNVAGLAETASIAGKEKGKVILLLNFPNNPTGYSVTEEEASGIAQTVAEIASEGTNVIVISDDAYFGLFYEDVFQESIFALIANSNPRALGIKLDGATKEHFVWGFRVGFITYSCGGDAAASEEVYEALEKKTMGAIRGCVSNCPHISQTLVLRALESPCLATEKQDKYEILKARALKVKETLSDSRYDDAWTYYPFNSGYFMCLKLKTVGAEELRKHVLDKYGVGVIASSDTDIRVAFSCTEVDDIPELFDSLYRGVGDIRGVRDQ